MRLLLLLAVFLFAVPASAQDAGTLDAGEPVIVMETERITAAPVVDAGVPEAAVPSDPASAAVILQTVFKAVETGNWWLAAAGFLLLVVSALRTIGKKFHEWLPDDNVLDKPLIFLYDTKVGGWILNWLTAMAGGFGTAMAAGAPVDGTLWKSVLMVSLSGSALYELYKDVMEWWAARKKAAAEKAAAEAAAKAAVVAPAPAPAPTEPPKP